MTIQDLAHSDNIAVAQSARRVLSKSATPTVDDLKTASFMRKCAASGDPAISGPATAWLLKRGLSTQETAPLSKEARAVADRVGQVIDRVVKRANRERWSRERSAIEITTAVQADIQKSRRK
jgi:hypothetical protein